MDSYYILDALQNWTRELAAAGTWEKPYGMYGWELTAGIHPRGSASNGADIVWQNNEFDFEFDWRFDEKEEPNSGEFTIYNLTDDTIRRIFVGDSLGIYGGFEAGKPPLVVATISGVETEWKGADKAVTLYLSESSMNYNNYESRTWYDIGAGANIQEFTPGGAQVSITYNAGVRASHILEKLVEMTGFPCQEMTVEQDVVFREPVIVEGPLYTKVWEFAAMCGSSAYMANGFLIIKNLNIDRGRDRLLVSQQTGLLDAPAPFAEESQSDEKPSYRGYTVKMLGNARVQIGVPVLLQSRFVDAQLTVLRGRHSLNGKELITEATLVE